jgi:pimeloyl-ACP methyl ester carboxylesterase
MGSDTRWWDPLRDALQVIGIEPQPLSLPSLEDDGPEAWCREVRHHTGQKPLVLLMGHSLGAVVCLEVARTTPVAGVLLLACPPFFADFSPASPPATGLSKAALARATSFLKATCAHASEITAQCVHFVGSKDP